MQPLTPMPKPLAPQLDENTLWRILPYDETTAIRVVSQVLP